MSDRGAQYDRGYIDGLYTALSEVQSTRNTYESDMGFAYAAARRIKEVRGTAQPDDQLKDYLKGIRQEVNDATQPLLAAEERIGRFLDLVESHFDEDYPDMDPDHPDYVPPKWA